MLALGALFALRQRSLECVDQDRSCEARLDHVVDVAPLGGGVRVREALLVVGDQLLAPRLGVFRVGELTAEDE